MYSSRQDWAGDGVGLMTVAYPLVPERFLDVSSSFPGRIPDSFPAHFLAIASAFLDISWRLRRPPRRRRRRAPTRRRRRCRLFIAAKAIACGGGVLIGGGIAPHIVPLLRNPSFRARFAAKGRFAGYVERIPIAVIVRPEPTFLGLAALAARGD